MEERSISNEVIIDNSSVIVIPSNVILPQKECEKVQLIGTNESQDDRQLSLFLQTRNKKGVVFPRAVALNNYNNVSNNNVATSAQKKFFDFIVPPKFQETEMAIESQNEVDNTKKESIEDKNNHNDENKNIGFQDNSANREKKELEEQQQLGVEDKTVQDQEKQLGNTGSNSSQKNQNHGMIQGGNPNGLKDYLLTQLGQSQLMISSSQSRALLRVQGTQKKNNSKIKGIFRTTLPTESQIRALAKEYTEQAIIAHQNKIINQKTNINDGDADVKQNQRVLGPSPSIERLREILRQEFTELISVYTAEKQNIAKSISIDDNTNGSVQEKQIKLPSKQDSNQSVADNGSITSIQVVLNSDEERQDQIKEFDKIGDAQQIKSLRILRDKQRKVACSAKFIRDQQDGEQEERKIEKFSNFKPNKQEQSTKGYQQQKISNIPDLKANKEVENLKDQNKQFKQQIDPSSQQIPITHGNLKESTSSPTRTKGKNLEIDTAQLGKLKSLNSNKSEMTEEYSQQTALKQQQGQLQPQLLKQFKQKHYQSSQQLHQLQNQPISSEKDSHNNLLSSNSSQQFHYQQPHRQMKSLDKIPYQLSQKEYQISKSQQFPQIPFSQPPILSRQLSRPISSTQLSLSNNQLIQPDHMMMFSSPQNLHSPINYQQFIKNPPRQFFRQSTPKQYSQQQYIHPQQQQKLQTQQKQIAYIPEQYDQGYQQRYHLNHRSAYPSS